jgi:trans-aconitate methyltransferase
VIALPSFLWWDHNAYYHPWLLRQVPSGAARALDVGCGSGALTRRLSERVTSVDAVDSSPAMIERATERVAVRTRWLVGDVLTTELHPDGYDVVTALSSLHHLPLRAGLTRLAELVRPGGTLAVVGLYRHATLADLAMQAVTLPANAAVGMVLAARGRAGKPNDEGMPVCDPDTTLAEIRAAAAESLPGAVVRRRVFWRYTLLWRRPPA